MTNGRFPPESTGAHSMSITNGEAAMADMTDQATYQRLEKDVSGVRNDIAARADQTTEALNGFAGAPSKRAKRGVKEARANMDSTIDDISARGSAMLDAPRKMPRARSRIRWKRSSCRPRARPWFLIGATWHRRLGTGDLAQAIWRRRACDVRAHYR